MTMYCLLGSIVTVGLCYIYLHCPFHAFSTEGGDIAIGTSTGDIYLFAVYDEGHSYRLVASVKVVYKVILEFGSLYLNIKSIEKIKNCVSSDTLQSIKRQKIDRKVIQKTDRKEIERSLTFSSPPHGVCSEKINENRMECSNFVEVVTLTIYHSFYQLTFISEIY